MRSKDKPYISPDFVKVVTAEGNTEKIQDKTKIANEMNKQFVEMGAKLANKLAPANTNFSDYLPSPNPNHERFVLHTILESRVGTLIKELDEDKGVGIDKIPPKILKWGAHILIPILFLADRKGSYILYSGFCLLSVVVIGGLRIIT